MVLIQSLTSWILLKLAIMASFGPLTDSGTLSYQVFFKLNCYSVEVWSRNVPDSFVEELESGVGGDHAERDKSKDSDPVGDKISWSHHDEITTDGSSYRLNIIEPAPVCLAYFLTGKFFMKLRLNIFEIIIQLMLFL